MYLVVASLLLSRVGSVRHLPVGNMPFYFDQPEAIRPQAYVIYFAPYTPSPVCVGTRGRQAPAAPALKACDNVALLPQGPPGLPSACSSQELSSLCRHCLGFALWRPTSSHLPYTNLMPTPESMYHDMITFKCVFTDQGTYVSTVWPCMLTRSLLLTHRCLHMCPWPRHMPRPRRPAYSFVLMKWG